MPERTEDGPPASITADELAYQATVFADVRAAQVALTSWSRHLAAKYQLQQGDNITEDGKILRKAAQES